jgi:uncharacterized protein YdiU (UPF0061 family)
MHHLGVPTTRAGCVITSDTYVVHQRNIPPQKKLWIVCYVFLKLIYCYFFPIDTIRTDYRHPRQIRDLKYDGHPIRERATVVLRIAPSFLRFGSFQIANPEDETTGRCSDLFGESVSVSVTD